MNKDASPKSNGSFKVPIEYQANFEENPEKALSELAGLRDAVFDEINFFCIPKPTSEVIFGIERRLRGRFGSAPKED